MRVFKGVVEISPQEAACADMRPGIRTLRDAPIVLAHVIEIQEAVEEEIRCEPWDPWALAFTAHLLPKFSGWPL